MYWLREEEIPCWEPGGDYDQLCTMLKHFNCIPVEERSGINKWQHTPSGSLIMVDVLSDGSFDLFVSLRNVGLWIPCDYFDLKNDRREILSLANTLKEVEELPFD